MVNPGCLARFGLKLHSSRCSQISYQQVQQVISIFHGNDEKSHDSYQDWRSALPDGFNLTEKAHGSFVAHRMQDKRENLEGRGCHHQGGCYTTARKVCSASLAELLEWVKVNKFEVRTCKHCDTKRFPFESQTGKEQEQRLCRRQKISVRPTLPSSRRLPHAKSWHPHHRTGKNCKNVPPTKFCT